MGLASGNPEQFPGKKPRREIPQKTRYYLQVLSAQGEILLQRRPDQGIWGGLWCFPEFDDELSARAWLDTQFGAPAHVLEPRQSLQHTFSHYRLELRPLLLRLTPGNPSTLADNADQRWFYPDAVEGVGLPAPIVKLLTGLPISAQGQVEGWTSDE